MSRPQWLVLGPILAGVWGVLAPGGWWAVPAMAFAGPAVAAAMIDLEVHRLPDRLVAAATVLVVGALVVAAVMTRRWEVAGRAFTCGMLLFTVMLGLAMVGSLGGGDVKLAGPLGAVLGVHSWGAVWAGVLAGFVIAGVVGIAMAVACRRSWWHVQVPMGPGLVAGALAIVIALQPAG